MSQKGRRYPLKPKEVREVLHQASEQLQIDLERMVNSKSKMEVVESEWSRIFLVDGKPVLFESGKLILPTLLFSTVLEKMPKIVVDMGAVPYVCKGADVMAPGIVRIDGEFSQGEIVTVVDIKHGKTLSLGKSLIDSTSARATRQGAVVENLHYVSDKIWDIARNLANA